VARQFFQRREKNTLYDSQERRVFKEDTSPSLKSLEEQSMGKDKKNNMESKKQKKQKLGKPNKR
jgi:hypothetical protein